MLLVIGGLDQFGVLRHAQRRGLELLQALDGAGHDAILRPLLGRQVKQDDRHLDIDEMGGDLRTHHTGAEDGDFSDLESTHKLLLNCFAHTATGVFSDPCHSTRCHTCVR